jgi:hypothetical protein
LFGQGGKLWLVPLLLSAGVVPVQATVISYEVASLGGNTFEYRYAVSNDTLATDVEEISIFFDADLFENLRVPVARPGWDALVIQPDLALPDDGFYDALALGVGIAPGGSLDGFVVWADFLGGGSPGSQRFEILDPFDFSVLDSGVTSRVPVGGAPEPATPWSAAVGFLGMTLLARRRPRKTTRS